MRSRHRFGGVLAATAIALAALPVVVGPVAATDASNDATFRSAWQDPNETLITLTDDITLDCALMAPPWRDSATAIVVDGAGFTLHNPCTDGRDGLVQDGSGSVTLRNITLTGNADSGDGLHSAGPVVVENAELSDHGGDGFEADGAITVTSSTIADNGEDGVDTDAGATISVTGSTVSGNGDDGIEGSGDVTVTGSSIVDNDDDGIDLDELEGDVTVSTTSVSTNGDNGIETEFDGNISSVQSSFVGNGSDGIQTNAEGDIDVTRSTFADNGDDGISLDGIGAVSFVQSTADGNAEDGVDSNGSATITNSTITDNGEYGVFAAEDALVTHSTITGNNVNVGNLLLLTIHLEASVLVDAGTANCEGPSVVDEGHNFVDDDSCGDIAANDADPQLGSLGANGGVTDTRLPAETSPLVDAIPTADCHASVTTDQRGITRPQGDGCDIGAVEVQAVPPPPSETDEATPSPTPVANELPDTAAGDANGLLASLAALLALSGIAALGRLRLRMPPR